MRKPGRPLKADNSVTVRDALVTATVDAVAKRGVYSVTAREVCATADVTFAAVNYNFGTWESLLAQATAKVYGDYIDHIWQAANEGEQTPELRLRRYVQAQWTWAGANPGWSALLNYPQTASEVYERFFSGFPAVALGKFQLNQARLFTLVMDVRNGKITDFPYNSEDFPKPKLLEDPKVVAFVVSVGWAILGASVWFARGLIGDVQRGPGTPSNQFLVDSHLNSIVEIVKTAAI